MLRNTRTKLLQPDIFDVLSATWVFASNDENPIITYRGVRHRLGLGSSFDVKGLVRTRGDLFRPGVPNSRLKAWQQAMFAGKQLPGWIRTISDEEQRRKTIEGLTPADVFRSQFRANKGASRSSLEIIDWGLTHIERLRKSSYEARTGVASSWQMWMVFATSLAGVIATIAAALLKEG